jgi:hypothetical protein
MRERRKAKDEQSTDPEDDLKISDLPEQFHDSLNLAWSVLGKDANGGHNPHRQRWNEQPYAVRSQARVYTVLILSNHSSLQNDELHALVNTTVQKTNVAETDLDRRLSHLSQVPHAHARRTAAPSTRPTLSTRFFPAARRPGGIAQRLSVVFRALARVEAARLPNQVSAAASRVAREVNWVQDAPASERRITVVAPSTLRTPRRLDTRGRGRYLLPFYG